MFVKGNKKGLKIEKTLAYCTMEIITAIKRFMIQALGRSVKNRALLGLNFYEHILLLFVIS